MASFLLMDEDRKAGFYSPKSTFYWTFAYKITRATSLIALKSIAQRANRTQAMEAYATLRRRVVTAGARR